MKLILLLATLRGSCPLPLWTYGAGVGESALDGQVEERAFVKCRNLYSNKHCPVHIHKSEELNYRVICGIRGVE